MPRSLRSRVPRGNARRSEAKRWIVMLIVLTVALGIHSAEHMMRMRDAPVVGNAYVVDGDTLMISGIRIRLIGIDAPELDQTCLDAQGRDWPCGRQASGELRNHIRSRDLTCQPASRDKYGRTLATCALPDGSNINAWMVEQGWAVVSGYAEVYRSQQAEAKSAGRGLWAGSFSSPRQWRQQHPRTDGNHKD